MHLPKFPSTLKHIFFWGLGFLLLWIAFRNQDFTKLWEQLKEIRWQWAFAILGVTILNHLSRAKRWQMMLHALGHKPTLAQSFLALMFGYLVSYAIPRLGEISRCVVLKDEVDIPFQQNLGTVFTERLVDVFCLAMVIFLAFWIEFALFSSFFIDELFLPILTRFAELSSHVPAIITLVLLVGIGVTLAVFKFLRHTHWLKLIAFVKEVMQGILSVFAIRNKLLFFVHTLFIWLSYFLMTYLWFDAFAATEHLSLAAGLTMMAIGSLGRLVPIQGGGMGAYHFLFQQGLLLYGISELYGLALAVVIHGFQTIYYLIVGGGSTLILAFRKSERQSSLKNSSMNV